MMLAIWNILSDVEFVLLNWQIHIPVGILLLASFLLGALSLYLVSVVAAWRDRSELRRLRRRVEELEQSPVRFSSGPLQGPPVVPMPGMPGSLPSTLPYRE